MTSLAANTGQSIRCLGEKVLVDDELMQRVFDTFQLSVPLPTAFQMVFAVAVKDDEVGYSRWQPLIYSVVKKPRSWGRESSGPAAGRNRL